MNKPLMDMIKSEISSVPGVEQVAYRNVGKFGGKTEAGDKEITADYENIDENYLPALQTKILLGRNFSKGMATDQSNSVLVNESFVKAAGLADPIGKTVDYMNLPGWGTRKVTIIGVVKDYHYASLKEIIKPQIFIQEPLLPLGLFVAKIKPTAVPSTILALEKAYRKLAPEQPFQYDFISDLNRKSYEEENRWKKIIGFATIFTVFISCIGLFGLSILSAGNRVKEMGVRKVLGASALQIAGLISRDFLKLVLIAFLIAIPGAGYAIHQWLQNFAYKIDMSWWLFIAGGLFAMLIAVLTVGGQALKVAFANPVKALKTE
jgi:putative ABC transport system permease protein